MKEKKELAYVEPDDYFPKSIREKHFGISEEDAKKKKTKDKKDAEDKSS